MISQLSILGLVLRSGRRDEIRGELGSLAHVSLDLHLALHEGDLWVQFSEANLLEIIVCHSEGSIGLGWLALFARTLSILQVNLVDESRLGTLLRCNLETEDGINLGDESLAIAARQVSRHHVENALGFETRSTR